MTEGVIKLGQEGDLRPYAVEQRGEGLNWDRSNANPYAATVNTSNPYDKVDSFNEWVQENWQAGVGRVDPEAGGFLYSEVDSRVPNQLILPPLVKVGDKRVTDGTMSDCRYMPENIAGTVQVGAGGYQRLAMRFTTGSITTTTYSAAFYARVPVGCEVRISTYSNTGSSPNDMPNTQSQTATITNDRDDYNFYWWSVPLAIAASTTQWLVIEPVDPTDTIEVAYATGGYNRAMRTWDGSTWTNHTSQYALFYTNVYSTSVTEDSYHLIRFNGNLYLITNLGIYRYVSGAMTSIKTFNGEGLAAADTVSVEVFGPYLYIAREGEKYLRMDTSQVLTEAASAEASLFLAHGDLLYRADGNNLYYSNDGSVWEGPFAVGGSDVSIRGMAGMGDSLYCATDKALMALAPGNFVIEVGRFGAEDAANGTGMIEYQGALYIPAAGRIFRVDQSWQWLDVWTGRAEDLPASRVGVVSKLIRMNNWLVAYVSNPPLGDPGPPTLWAYQDEGWHFLAMAPYGNAWRDGVTTCFYDRSLKRLWFTADNGGPFYIEINDYTLNPYTTDDSLYMPFGWMEQERFFGGSYLLRKLWQSVSVIGDNLSSSNTVDVYWKSEGDTVWQHLGTATSDGDELLFDSPRPQGRWLKLAVRLSRKTGTQTPRVRAIVLRFLPMVNDRIKDSLTITLSDNVQGPDGDPDSYTLEQQRAHLMGTDVRKAEGHIVYQDPYGDEYRVVLTGFQEQITKFAWYNGTRQPSEVRINLVLEQVVDDPA